MVTINITVKKTARYLLTPLALYLFSLSHCLTICHRFEWRRRRALRTGSNLKNVTFTLVITNKLFSQILDAANRSKSFVGGGAGGSDPAAVTRILIIAKHNYR
jgi:hypothetical protein